MSTAASSSSAGSVITGGSGRKGNKSETKGQTSKPVLRRGNWSQLGGKQMKKMQDHRSTGQGGDFFLSNEGGGGGGTIPSFMAMSLVREGLNTRWGGVITVKRGSHQLKNGGGLNCVTQNAY